MQVPNEPHVPGHPHCRANMELGQGTGIKLLILKNSFKSLQKVQKVGNKYQKLIKIVRNNMITIVFITSIIRFILFLIA